jgi:spermidine synthase
MRVTRTRNGLRLSQHGVVISELRTSSGPTHSVFDVLAALVAILAPAGRFGMLGFAGGGMVAPLDALGYTPPIHAVDLDNDAHALFARHCPGWTDRVVWHHGDAVEWLRGQPADFDLLLDDLSVAADGDVYKPAVSWDTLPPLMRARLRPAGVVLYNLLLSPADTWTRALAKTTVGHHEALVVDLDEFENRILVAGDDLPSARDLGGSLRNALRRIRSRQAGRIRVSTYFPADSARGSTRITA